MVFVAFELGKPPTLAPLALAAAQTCSGTLKATLFATSAMTLALHGAATLVAATSATSAHRPPRIRFSPGIFLSPQVTDQRLASHQSTERGAPGPGRSQLLGACGSKGPRGQASAPPCRLGSTTILPV